MRAGVMVILFWLFGAIDSSAYGRHGMEQFAFSASLRSHGEWIAFGNGVSVWRPYHISQSWRPYSVGRWAWTNQGWYWVSYEPWGQITYHYGRWYYDDYYGWVWVPDDEWAPAWVDWNCQGDYVGWAPMSPVTIVRFSFTFGARPVWATHRPHWTVVYYQHLVEPNIQKHLLAKDAVRDFGNGRVSGETRGGVRPPERGPDPSEVEKRAHVRISRTDVGAVERVEASKQVPGEPAGRKPVREGNRPVNDNVTKERSVSNSGDRQESGPVIRMTEPNKRPQRIRATEAENDRVKKGENWRDASVGRLPDR